eukprot:GILI01028240.1.p1 GENE.GILI01028240.1~~GILI01028240.1.p1  ORF type:complete len:225 (-),score=40.48 GILI01028240.1:81-755(-)
MELQRRKGDEQLVKQRGTVPIEQVTELSFTDCCLVFDKLAPFTNLQKLLMVSMKPQLKDLAMFPFSSPLAQTLRKLNLSDNKIVTLVIPTPSEATSEPASFKLPALEQLILSNNLLTTVESFAPALTSGCPKLQWLELDANPIQPTLKADRTGYRDAVFEAIPFLMVLDGCDRAGEELSDIDSDEESFEGDSSDEQSEEDEEDQEEADGDEDHDQPAKKILRSE